jgi:hypothetical protein
MERIGKWSRVKGYEDDLRVEWRRDRHIFVMAIAVERA